MALITAIPTARARREIKRSGVVQKITIAANAPAEAITIPVNCSSGCVLEAVNIQPAAANRYGSRVWILRSFNRSERLLHHTIATIVHTCGMALSKPIVTLLLVSLKLRRISGVQTLSALRVLVRQK
ncbi:hypothetical protein D3C86_1887430 [compost metagenome]